MKKLLLFALLLTLGFRPAMAQTTLDTAVNIVATDINGNPFDLFATLNSGKWVVLDFLFTTCGPCQAAAPKYYGAFTNYGANSPSAQIVFVSINRDDNNAVMHNWEATYANPTGPYPIGISGTEGSATAGPQAFYTLYGIGAFPTFILIEPNKHIAEKDMWPINDASAFTTYFQAHGLNPVGIAENNALDGIAISPVPAMDYITISSENNAILSLEVYDQLGKLVFQQESIAAESQFKLDISTYEPGVYFTRIRTSKDYTRNMKFIKL